MASFTVIALSIFVNILFDTKQEGRSNTWPQNVQPWSQQGQGQLGLDLIGPPDHTTGYHRPISMQMSDPLSGRNIWQNQGLGKITLLD